ncbi:copper resistance protein B [Thiomicrorhabdus sp.]|uniref:copper resistance protein B n=1 Tax=Thiomicrorhabdus sp. TaxID=2039724 RepID=UPI0029C85C86|nr:copper resistance protein B [Thiomicrorhabdus sp.]
MKPFIHKFGLGALLAISVPGLATAGGEYDPLISSLWIDQLEVSTQADQPLSWDAQAWFGTNWHRLYINSEGQSASGETESENQLLYSKPVTRLWDLQFGLGYDQNQSESQSWGVVGVQGLAPYFFEVRAALMANDHNVGARFDASYDALITQRLILVPSVKLNFYANDDSKMELGSGLSSSELGLRLRYEISRKFAPYVGVKWNEVYGKTADYIRAGVGRTSELSAVAGVRIWF